MRESQGRASRRHHVKRLKQRRKSYWGYPNRFATGLTDAPVAPVPMNHKQLGQVVQHPQMCSCLGCGNSRHNNGWESKTMNERRWADQYREQLDEV